ncbi:DUF4214 domain-containing protein [Sulfurimonas sp.]|uniref:DUF4214 domain-containing protein n=1 Tax=Sulfurimonas sp. TaxID=2022749 RepID=UPI00286DDE22|nr:DUF4214 domain-containing protein [Sulfurimonas sp.]
MVSINDVCKLYVATFNRAPDAAGLDYWVNSSGLELEEIAQSFFDQPETQALYPTGTSMAAFVTSVYQNLFNRAPDQDGLAYWVNDLDAGSVSKQNFILAVINGALNTLVSQDATILENKQNVGLVFVNNGLEDVQLAKTVMEQIDNTESSVLVATNVIFLVATPIGNLTAQMLIDQTFYTCDADPESTYFENGQDSMHKVTFNQNGTTTHTIFTAPFGSSQWESESIFTTTQTWSIDNGRLIISDYDSNAHWTDTFTLISQTDNQVIYNDAMVNYNENGDIDYDNMNVLSSTTPLAPRTGVETLSSINSDFYYAGVGPNAGGVDYEVFIASDNIDVSAMLGINLDTAFILNIFDTPFDQTIIGTNVNDVFNWRGGNDTFDGAGGGSDSTNGGCDAIWLNTAPTSAYSMMIDTSTSGVIALVENGNTLVRLVKNQDGSVDITAEGSTVHTTNIELFNAYTVPQDGSTLYNISIDLIGTQSGTFDASF